MRPGHPAPPAGLGDLSPDNALWRFALDFYGREGVAAACLTLQERLGADVNILLLAIFAQAVRGKLLRDDELAAADALVRDWRADVVQVLRRLRIGLKSGPSPAPSPLTDGLRNGIKAAELTSEQVELAMLCAWLERQGGEGLQDMADAEAGLASVARYFAADAALLAAPAIEDALQTLNRTIRQIGGDGQALPS